MRVFAFYEREKTKVGRTVIHNYQWEFSRLTTHSLRIQLVERARGQAEGSLYGEHEESDTLHIVKSTILPVGEVVAVVNQFQSLPAKYMTHRQLALQGIIGNETIALQQALHLFQLADRGYIPDHAQLVAAYEYMVCCGIQYVIEHGATLEQLATHLQLSPNHRPHQLLMQDCLHTIKRTGNLH